MKVKGESRERKRRNRIRSWIKHGFKGEELVGTRISVKLLRKKK